MRSAGKHGIGISSPNDFGGFTDRLARSGTGGEAVQVWALCVKDARQVTCRHVWFLFKFALRMQQFHAGCGELFEIEFPFGLGLGDQHHEAIEVLLAFARAQVNTEAGRGRDRCPERPNR